MENASKALIIAASVLVAIMIVSMGITIFNKAQSSADTTSLDTTEINMFNQKFERYSGTQLGSQVKSLISYAISNYSTNKEDTVKLPTVDFKGKKEPGATGGAVDSATTTVDTYVDTLGTIRNTLISTHPYYVKLSYGDSGLINMITIYWSQDDVE